MSSTFLAALCQMSSGGEPAANCAQVRALLKDAAAAGARLAALPEFWPCLSSDDRLKLGCAESEGQGPLQDLLANQAAKHGMYVCGGSIPLQSEEKDKVYNSCLFYGPDGSLISRYDKIHLFRYSGPDRSYDETETCMPGRQPITAASAIGRIGFAVCYDLRFAELFLQLSRPDLIIVPAAFTMQTGAAHWEALIRARAIECQCHVLAPAQCGEHHGALRSWGHSLAVSPWGDILADAGIEAGCTCIAIDPQATTEVRSSLPMTRML